MAIQLPPAQTPDPGAALTPCEVPDCETVKPLREMWSYKISCMQTGDAGTPAHECDAVQHYGCSQEHALALVAACAEQHMPAAHDKLVQLAQAQAATRAVHIAASEAARDETSEEPHDDATAPPGSE